MSYAHVQSHRHGGGFGVLGNPKHLQTPLNCRLFDIHEIILRKHLH